MMQVNKKCVLWILVFVAASLITVLFLGTFEISGGIGVSELLIVIASILFYAVPIAIVVYVISLVKRYVDCKVVESERAAKIELLKQQIERIEGKVDKIAENRG